MEGLLVDTADMEEETATCRAAHGARMLCLLERRVSNNTHIVQVVYTWVQT
jgi:hypothetical protein